MKKEIIKKIQSISEIAIRCVGGGVTVSSWVDDPEASHCSMRIVVGGDPMKIADRVAFIEKTPRIRTNKFTTHRGDFENWSEGPDGHAPEYGKHEESRDWCDRELVRRGYVLPMFEKKD